MHSDRMEGFKCKCRGYQDKFIVAHMHQIYIHVTRIDYNFEWMHNNNDDDGFIVRVHSQLTSMKHIVLKKGVSDTQWCICSFEADVPNHSHVVWQRVDTSIHSIYTNRFWPRCHTLFYWYKMCVWAYQSEPNRTW